MYLSWKEHHKLLPYNYENSVARLSSHLKRLRRDTKVCKEYDSIIQDQLQSVVLKRVYASKYPDVGKVHYLPHHGVVRRDSMNTKLRNLLDASSKATSNSPSLNDCLCSGPALTPTIFKNLIWFRGKKIALVGDIEKALLPRNHHISTPLVSS